MAICPLALSSTFDCGMKTFVIFATIAQLFFGSMAFTSTNPPDAEAFANIKGNLFLLKTS